MHAFYLVASFVSTSILSRRPQYVVDNKWNQQHHQPGIDNHQTSSLMKLNYALKDHQQDSSQLAVPIQRLENCEDCYAQTMTIVRKHLHSHPKCHMYIKEAVDTLTTSYYQGSHNADSISRVFRSALVVQRAIAHFSLPMMYVDLLSQYEYSKTFGFRKSVSSYHAFAYLIDTLFAEMESNPNQNYDQDLVLKYKTWKAIDALVENDIKDECPMLRTAKLRAKRFYEKYVDSQEEEIDFQ